MTTVRFDLEPHQWPPHACGERLGFADAVFSVEWDGAETEIAARLVQIGVESVLMFFRALEDLQIYVVATSSGICLSPRWHHLISQQSKVDFLKEQLPKALKSDEFASYGRLFPFREAGQHSTNLFVAHDGASGAWTTEVSCEWTPFCLHHEADLLPQSIANPDSSVGFALRWARLSRELRCEKAVRFANGDWKEFREITHAVACFAESPLASTESWLLFNGKFWIKTGQHNFDGCAPGARLRRWGSYIQNYFGPTRNEALSARHLCVEQHSLSPLILLKLTTPTQHERLEAALTLREWAKGKIPQREARLLLPKL